MEHFNGKETVVSRTTVAQNKKRNEAAWGPVIGIILDLVSQFDDIQFRKHGPCIYNEIVKLLLQDITTETRYALHTFLVRVGNVFFGSRTIIFKADQIPKIEIESEVNHSALVLVEEISNLQIYQ